MPDLPISGLPELTATTSTAEYAVELSGTTYKIKQSTLTPFPLVYGLFAQTGSSTPVSGTTVETSIIGSGTGTLSVPINGFRVGDSFNGKLNGHISCVGTAEIQIRVKANSVLLGDTGVIALDASTNKHWQLDLNFTIRSIGSVGSIVSYGSFGYIKNSGLNFEGSNFVTITPLDTTILNTITITASLKTGQITVNIGNFLFI